MSLVQSSSKHSSHILAMTQTCQYVNLSQGKVRYLYKESQSNRGNILFIHGMSYPLEVWLPLQKMAYEMGWNTLSYDLYGRGSSSFTEGILSPQQLSDQVVQLLNQCMMTTPIHVITLSNADWIAITLATVIPEQISSISLIAPSGLDHRTLNFRMKCFARWKWSHRFVNTKLRKKIYDRMVEHAHKSSLNPSSEILEIYKLSQQSILQNQDFCQAFWSQVLHALSLQQALDLLASLPTHIPLQALRFAHENDSQSDGVSIFYHHTHCLDQSFNRGTHMALLEIPELIWPTLHQFMTIHS